MKTPIDTVVGQIKEYDPERGRVIIECTYPDWFTMSKRGYKQCLIQMLDSRPLSSKQRNSCYALINEIAEFTGMSKSMTKEWLKIKFLTDDLQQTADKIFSLSNAPMSLVCAFQKFLVGVILDYDIPCRFPLLNMVDDIPDYLYACLVHKKCCICGKTSDLHHVDSVGSHGYRDEIVHEGMRVLPLCRMHHEEIHRTGKTEFCKKYHVTDGIVLDKALCRLYKLKTRKEEKDA